MFENHQKSLIFLKIAKSEEQKLLNFLGTKNGEWDFFSDFLNKVWKKVFCIFNVTLKVLLLQDQLDRLGFSY